MHSLLHYRLVTSVFSDLIPLAQPVTVTRIAAPRSDRAVLLSEPGKIRKRQPTAAENKNPPPIAPNAIGWSASQQRSK